jgi:hypothetical protein
MEQIASHTEKNPPAGSPRGRSARGDGAARRAEEYGRLQIARLTKWLRHADVSLEEDPRAIARLVRGVRKLNLYQGVTVGSGHSRPRGAT